MGFGSKFVRIFATHGFPNVEDNSHVQTMSICIVSSKTDVLSTGPGHCSMTKVGGGLNLFWNSCFWGHLHHSSALFGDKTIVKAKMYFIFIFIFIWGDKTNRL